VKSAFTLVELLVVIGIVAILAAISFPVYGWCIRQAQASVSGDYLHQLVAANWSYAAEHDSCFCPAQDQLNLTRWHGGRGDSGSAFDTTKGFLSPYLGTSGMVQRDPLFTDYIKGSGSWEDGSGGFGYNEIYIGGTPQNNYQGISTLKVKHPSSTVMFGTTAFAMGDNQLQEYPFCEPPQWVDSNGNLAGSMQPSLDFRANGKALVGWCDGHVTAEKMNDTQGPNYYGGSNVQANIGWFGPVDNNGYWNPDYTGP
jgi:prepilin-type N-terminal cleavage/methylation domain-containing protein/prepilin-type processing-associated H-X9-DG protein